MVKAHDAPDVKNEAVEIPRNEPPRSQRDKAQNSLRKLVARGRRSIASFALFHPNATEHLAYTVEDTKRCQDAAQIPNEPPSIHLPRGPRSLPEEEIRDQRRKRPHHKAAAPSEGSARYDGDGRHRLKARKRSEQDSPRCRKGGENHHGHSIAQARSVFLIPREEQNQRRHRNDDAQQSRLIDPRHCACDKRNRGHHNSDKLYDDVNRAPHANSSPTVEAASRTDAMQH